MAQNKKLWKFMPLVRAIGVLSAVGVTTTLVTFAAIQSTGSALTGNTIQTASASLQISTNNHDYGDNVAGFTFNGLVPGGPAQPQTTTYTVYVKNTGTTSLNLSLNIPTPPNKVGTVDLSKVTLLLAPATAPGMPSFPTQIIPLSHLLAGQVLIDHSAVAVGSTVAFHVQVSMAADAVEGSGATISGLDLSFSGSPQ